MTEREAGYGWDLRCGDERDVLAHIDNVDAVITDVPYSARVKEGQRNGGRVNGNGWQPAVAGSIAYEAWTRDRAEDFCARWLPRTRRWFVTFGDHIEMRWLEDIVSAAGWMTWVIPWTKPDGGCRLQRDGPSPQAEWIFVSRPHGPVVRRYRPGFYDHPQDRGGGFVGTKPLALVRALVRDYSEPGDLVVDQFCGLGKTALACVTEGRRCITSEIDPKTYAKALARLRKGITVDAIAALEATAALQADARKMKQAKTGEMFPRTAP